MPSNLYGPGDNYHPENSHVIPSLLCRFHEAKLSGATGRKVEAKVVVDPEILGGIVARVGDVVIDGSVKGRLQELRDEFGA